MTTHEIPLNHPTNTQRSTHSERERASSQPLQPKESEDTTIPTHTAIFVNKSRVVQDIYRTTHKASKYERQPQPLTVRYFRELVNVHIRSAISDRGHNHSLFTANQQPTEAERQRAAEKQEQQQLRQRVIRKPLTATAAHRENRCSVHWDKCEPLTPKTATAHNAKR